MVSVIQGELKAGRFGSVVLFLALLTGSANALMIEKSLEQIEYKIEGYTAEFSVSITTPTQGSSIGTQGSGKYTSATSGDMCRGFENSEILDLNIQSDADYIPITSNISTFEDTRTGILNFYVEQFVNGRSEGKSIGETVRQSNGKAIIDVQEISGSALENVGDNLVDADFYTVIQYTAKLIEMGLNGKKLDTFKLFVPSLEGNFLQNVFAIVGKPGLWSEEDLARMEGESQEDHKLRKERLLGKKFWHVTVSMHNGANTNEDQQADAVQRFRLTENGFVDQLVVETGQLTLNMSLKQVRFLPIEVCKL